MNIGIIGGMGPEATASLFMDVIKYTDADCDQEHIRVFIDSNSSIPDRTAYILGQGEDPLPFLIETANNLEKMGADLLIMPCNTAHYFYDKIQGNINASLINMIEETAKHISQNYNFKKIGLLATLGTYKIGLYEKALKRYGMELIVPESDDKKIVMDYIYNVKKGKDTSADELISVSNNLYRLGAGLVIMGCTELSVAIDKYKPNGNYIDPLKVLSKVAIKRAGYKVRDNV